MNNQLLTRLTITTSLFITLIIVYMLGNGQYSHVLALLWIIATLLLLIASGRLSGPWRFHFALTPRTIGVVILVLLPVVVRILNYQPYRIHGDDLLTASFSQGFHPQTTNFFAGIPDGSKWVAKFPAPYFFLQKIFLRIAGASILTVKLSILPYVFIVSAMTYLIAQTILSPFAAVAATLLYAFMAISIYHETLGLHFVSSTAIYMIFFYALLRMLQKGKPFWFCMSGIFAALCYLSYTSSYIALPVLIIAIIGNAIRWNHKTRRLIWWTIVGFVVTIAPFFTYASTTENYFVGRIDQVSLLTGSWSAARKQSQTVSGAIAAVKENFVLSIHALTRDGVGGHGGYLFGRRAFFHPVGAVLFAIGSLIALLTMWHHGGLALVILTILLSYLTGVVLTIPPPAYHRLTLTFPFIAIISALPFHLLENFRRQKVVVIISCLLLAIYAGVNIHYVQTATRNEAVIEDAAIIRLINTTYPGRHIHVAAFPAFALDKLYPFFTPTAATSIDTQYHNAYLSRFNRNEAYLYVITLPEEFKRKFEDADPAGTYIQFSDKYGIFVNVNKRPQ